MKSLGEILAAVKPRSPQRLSSTPAAPRLHRVFMCVQIFAEVEVMAASVEEAFSIADQHADKAKRSWQTAPYAFRAAIQKPVDPSDISKGFKWVELVRDYTDQFDPSQGFLRWVEGKDCP